MRRASLSGFAGAGAILALLVSLGGASAAAASVPCGGGVEVRFRLPGGEAAPAAAQGRVVLVEVRSGGGLRELQAAWVGQRLHFWQEHASEQVYRALVGVDLEHKTGQFPLTLSAGLAGGGRVACSALLRVEEGEFKLEELTVAPGFVKLSARDRERAERESKRLQEIFNAVTPERLWSGGFRAPLEAAQGSGNFGVRRIFNQEPRSPHGGEDFSAMKGTPVLAAGRGRVALADDLFYSGNTVVLDHGLGLYTFYGHLDTLAVEAGETVEAGAQLGTVGATGRVTGPHLHWAARLNRARVNPLELVALAAE
ncbi:MAG: M23 family metallopeptidase [Candidatus Acidiferrales bacterium]